MAGASGIETITLARGPFRAELITVGASLRRLEVPGRDGRSANIVLGYRDLAAYSGAPELMGAVAGRYANRIGGARFTLDGTEHRLAANDGANSLHAGPHGFDQQDWQVLARDAVSATFGHVSPAGHNGFPGTLTVTARYALEPDGLSLALTATSDAPTVVNLTHHAYFNLAGEAHGDALGHWLQLPASRMTPVDARLLPTGALRDVTGTPFDFRTPKPVGRDITAEDAQLRLGRGYDHNFVLDPPGGTRRVATLYDPETGRVLDLHSSEPGLQLYTANYLGNGIAGTSGQANAPHAAICLEPQKFPDSPNQPGFPSARLDPGETYRHTIALRFRTADSVAAAFPSEA
jgi:aldose 1-epimerase